MIQSQRWCLKCKGYTLHGKQTLSCAAGCVLFLLISILTILCTSIFSLLLLPLVLSLVAVIWLVIAVLHELLTPWRCQHCGTTGNPSFMPRLPSRPAFPRVHLPSIDWAPVWSRMRRLPSVVDHGIRACWSLVETAYAQLPDWAQPIILALGLTAPVVIVAVGIWTVIHM